MGIAAKITSKGQVTVPKRIREHLGSQTVEFDIHGNDVILRPIKSVAGKLKKYADPNLMRREDSAWAEVARDRYGDR